MGRGDGQFDVVVIGGGFGGLAAAALAQRAGLTVALCESHTNLGGCAGYFDRSPLTFDAGATALMGLGRSEPIGALLASVGLDFEGAPTPAYRVCLPDGELAITPDSTGFEAQLARLFPGHDDRLRHFWRLQERVGRTLFAVASKRPRLPSLSPRDWLHNLRVLGVGGTLSAATWTLTVRHVLALCGLWDDHRHRALVAMLLQDTAQAGPETVPFANAAACLQAYRFGMSRPRGGMKALAEGLGQRFAALGGELRTATLVDRVEQHDDGTSVVITRRRDRLTARHVVFNLPLDRAAALLGRSLEGRLGRSERQSRAAWSAFTGYVAFRRDAVADGGPLFHQVLGDYDAPIHDGNNVLVSLSPEGDTGYGPEDVRVATMSTHVRPSEWFALDRPAYEVKKADYRTRMLRALRRALPDAPDALVHAEFATPRSFLRYTRRTEGLVGGPPVARRNSTLLAVGSDVLGHGLWVVGDSVFPGQGTMAVVLSAMGVVDRLVATGPRAFPVERQPAPDRPDVATSGAGSR